MITKVNPYGHISLTNDYFNKFLRNALFKRGKMVYNS